jgi:uncharacterized membrane protein YhaH (DUF805 family)
MRSILAWMGWRGRLRRTRFVWMWLASVLAFTALYLAVDRVSHAATLALYPPAFAVWFSLALRRLHDQARRGWWLLWLALPLAGPLLVAALLLLARGTPGDNPYGEDPRTGGRDYLVVSIHEAA